MKQKNICVYCSSSNYLEQKFYSVAEEIGEKMAKSGYNLVYGGTTIGCMGKVAENVIKYGGEVIGVIPKRIEEKGLTHPNASKVIITKDMRERKAKMEELADMFIALPGSFGTLEEISEIIVAKQLSYHQKAIVFLNVDEFYKPLFDMFEKYYKLGFAREANRELYHISNNVDDALEYLKSYKAKEFIFKY